MSDSKQVTLNQCTQSLRLNVRTELLIQNYIWGVANDRNSKPFDNKCIVTKNFILQPTLTMTGPFTEYIQHAMRPMKQKSL